MLGALWAAAIGRMLDVTATAFQASQFGIPEQSETPEVPVRKLQSPEELLKRCVEHIEHSPVYADRELYEDIWAYLGRKS